MIAAIGSTRYLVMPTFFIKPEEWCLLQWRLTGTERKTLLSDTKNLTTTMMTSSIPILPYLSSLVRALIISTLVVVPVLRLTMLQIYIWYIIIIHKYKYKYIIYDYIQYSRWQRLTKSAECQKLTIKSNKNYNVPRH